MRSATLGAEHFLSPRLTQAVVAGKTRVVFLTRGSLVLLAASKVEEVESYLSLVLETLYHQILFVLTARVHQVLSSSSSYDLRNLLGGTENVMAGLAEQALKGPAILAGGVRSLAISLAVREEAGRVLAHIQSQSSDILYAMLLVGDRLLTLLQPRNPEHRMHSTDLFLIVNFVNTQPALRGRESWTPLCLPRFNSKGFLYSYIGYCDEASDLCLLLVSTNQKPETFHLFQQWRAAVVQALERDGTLEAIRKAQGSEAAVPPGQSFLSDHQPQLLHFLYSYRPSQPASGDGGSSPSGVAAHLSNSSNLPSALAAITGQSSSQEAEATVNQYLSSPFQFPLNLAPESVWTAYQKSALMLRHSTAQPECTIPDAGAGGAAGAAAAGTEADHVAHALWEKPLAHGITYHTSGPFLTLALAGPCFEVHATFQATVMPADAQTICQRLINSIKRDSDRLFHTKPNSF